MASGNDDNLFKVSVIEDKGEKFKVHWRRIVRNVINGRGKKI